MPSHAKPCQAMPSHAKPCQATERRRDAGEPVLPGPDKFDTRHAFPKRYDGLTLILNGRKRILPGSVAFAGLYGAGDAFRIPARRPPVSDDPQVSKKIKREERGEKKTSGDACSILQQLRHMRRSTDLSLHTLHVLHDTSSTPDMHCKTVRRTDPFLSGTETHRAGSLAFAGAGLHSARDVFRIPARRPPASDDPQVSKKNKLSGDTKPAAAAAYASFDGLDLAHIASHCMCYTTSSAPDVHSQHGTTD